MKKFMAVFLLACVAVSAFGIDFAHPRFGLKAGAGVDITLVPAFGGEISLALDMENGSWLSVDLGFFHSYDKWEGGNYVEETTSDIFMLRANRVFNYRPREDCTFYFIGTGVAAVSVYWKETSPVFTDHLDEVDRTGGGFLVSLGMGHAFNGGLELKLELPILIVFGGYYGTRVSPMLGAGIGWRF